MKDNDQVIQSENGRQVFGRSTSATRFAGSKGVAITSIVNRPANFDAFTSAKKELDIEYDKLLDKLKTIDDGAKCENAIFQNPFKAFLIWLFSPNPFKL